MENLDPFLNGNRFYNNNKKILVSILKILTIDNLMTSL